MKLSASFGNLARAVRWHRRGLAAVAAAICLLATISALRPEAPPTTPVVVAVATIPAGRTLGAADVTLRDVPLEMVPDGALTSVDDAIGAAVAVTQTPRSVLTRADLTGTGLLPDGSDEVLVPFRVDDAGVVALLRIGDRIDVVGTRPDGGTATLATDVRVAALPARAESGGLVATSASSALVVVAIDPADAPNLASGASQMRLAVVMLGR